MTRKPTTKLCDVGFFHPHYVAVRANGKWCGHQHATRQDARDCNSRAAQGITPPPGHSPACNAVFAESHGVKIARDCPRCNPQEN